MQKKNILIIMIVFSIMVAGCCTIMQGTTQSIGISSVPTGAKVSVDNSEKGKTPIVVNLTRKDNHFVKIEMEGYLPYEATFTRGTSGWVWGNIVFGGIIGLAVDAMTGGLYYLTPNQVNAVLQTEKHSSLYKRGSLYVAVVLHPDPSWEKIGQLKKIN